jgi:hypothetical protein
VLKPRDDPNGGPADNERPVGELVHELIEDGKTYARAELNVVKATVTAKVAVFKLPAILFAVAFVLVLAAIGALAYGVAAGLATLIGPLAGGFIAFLLFAGLAVVLAWIGVSKLRENL